MDRISRTEHDGHYSDYEDNYDFFRPRSNTFIRFISFGKRKATGEFSILNYNKITLYITDYYLLIIVISCS